MIIIHTYGKVASQPLHAMLEQEFPGEVYYSHGIQDQIVSLVDEFVCNAKTDTSGLRSIFQDRDRIVLGLQRASEIGEEVVIISGVRDPILRSISAAIQNLEVMFDDCLADDPSATALNLADRIASLWQVDASGSDAIRRMCQVTVRAPLHWLADEIEIPFGLNILGQPFDRERGFVVIKHDNLKLLLYRYENAPRSIELGLEQIFPGRKFELPKKNQAKDKPSSRIYEALKATFCLAHHDLVEIYANPYVRHFFSHEEILSLIQRWQCKEAPEPKTLTATPKRRATVVIATLNHCAWIGLLLDSLFAQWRPDIDLLIIDDGSSDDTLDVVCKHLESRPDIPATFLRNEQAIGLGVIPQILCYTKNHIIIQADSDDIALPGRVDAILACFDRDPRCRLVTSNALMISTEGVPIGLYDTTQRDAILDDPLLPSSERGSSRWLGATSAMHRSLLEDFPPLDPEICPYGLDLLLALRATLTGTHHYLSQPLIGWRQHSRNSHRLIGGLAMEGERREHFASIELMVLAQKIRDVQFVRERSSEPQTFDGVLANCHALFFDRFRDWSEVKVGSADPLASHTTMSRTSSAPTYVAPVPPIVTLERGIRYSFGNREPLGAIASGWSGFYTAEADWIWTSSIAVIVFRVNDPTLKTVTIKLHGLPFLESQRMRLSANGASPREFKLARAETLEAKLFLQSTSLLPGYLTLIIESPDALIPDQAGFNSDKRLLGASLLWIEAN